MECKAGASAFVFNATTPTMRFFFVAPFSTGKRLAWWETELGGGNLVALPAIAKNLKIPRNSTWFSTRSLLWCLNPADTRIASVVQVNSNVACKFCIHLPQEMIEAIASRFQKTKRTLIRHVCFIFNCQHQTGVGNPQTFESRVKLGCTRVAAQSAATRDVQSRWAQSAFDIRRNMVRLL